MLKALLEKADKWFEDYRASTDRCTGKTEHGQASWDYTPPMSASRRLRERGFKGEKDDNVMLRGRRNHTLFLRYLDFGDPSGEKVTSLPERRSAFL